MTKSELVRRLMQRFTHIYQKDITNVVKLVFDELADALARGDRVELRGFGAFSVRERKSRRARNPKTNEVVMLGERVVPYFRAGKELRERINAGSDNQKAA